MIVILTACNASPNRALCLNASVKPSSVVANFTLDPIRIEWDRDGDGKPDGSVTASPVHPFYVVGTGWIDADHLQEGQCMLDEQGRTTTITSIGTVPGRAATYDIGLDQVHGFFAGATPQSFTLTHNANHDVNSYWKQADFIPGRVPPTRYERHHFFHDAWLAVKYEGLYRKGRLDQSFPTLHVTPVPGVGCFPLQSSSG